MDQLHRRDVLRLAGLAGAAFLGLGPSSRIFGQDAPPAPAPATGDYKAIVCLFLDGGLDHLHAVTPYDPPSYAALTALRPEIGVESRSTFLPLGSGGQGGRELAFHQAFTGFKTLYDRGLLAYLCGVGELSRPTTKAEIANGAYRLGRAAGSHNDGAAYANGFGYEGTQYGWGGLALDAVSGLNTRRGLAAVNLYDSIFASGRLNQRTQVSSAADADNLVGLAVLPGFADVGLSNTMRGFLLGPQRDHLMEDAYTALAKHVDSSALEARQAFAASEAAVPPFTYPDGTPTWMGRDNDLARQFRSVARLMHQRQFLGVRRQIFNLGLRTFDTHAGQSGNLEQKFGTIDRAITYFIGLLETLGLLDQVTIVINSEFGRTLNGNGSGTDHGWGSGWFAIGGAVKGGAVYGRVPIIDRNGPDYVAPTNLIQIPAIAPEQVGAAVARWFGVADADVTRMFPRLSAFSGQDAGFMDLPAMAPMGAGGSGSGAATKSSATDRFRSVEVIREPREIG